MKIAVNTRLLQVNKLEGIGWFTFEILRRMVLNHPEVEFHFIFDRKPSSFFVFGPNVVVHQIGPPTRHVLIFPLWFNFILPKLLRKINPDVFISPDSIGSLNCKCKQIIVMHDLNFIYHPEWLPKQVAHFYNKYSPLLAKKADTIVTVSNYSAQDIIKNFNVAAEKVHVVSNAVSSSFSPITEKSKEEVRSRITNGHPYFVYVGSLHARKNIKNMLLAFDLFASNQTDVHLVLVGTPLWNDKMLVDIVNKLDAKDRIHFVGRLEGKEINSVVAAALAMTFIPFFEGFGIPVLEAFACEIPLLGSNRTAIPEVAQDAALLVDPESIQAIADGMERIATDNSLRTELIEKGRRRVKDFSWDRSAEKMWEITMKTLVQ